MMGSPPSPNGQGEAQRAAALRKFRKDANAGGLSLLLLSLIVRAKRPVYGYEIARMLQDLAENRATPMHLGAIYPALRSLEKLGLVSSTVEPSVSSPPRKYYRASDSGIAVLPEWTRIWSTTNDFIQRVLDRVVDSKGRDDERPSSSGSRVSKRTRTRTRARVEEDSRRRARRSTRRRA